MSTLPSGLTTLRFGNVGTWHMVHVDPKFTYVPGNGKITARASERDAQHESDRIPKCLFEFVVRLLT